MGDPTKFNLLIKAEMSPVYHLIGFNLYVQSTIVCKGENDP